MVLPAPIRVLHVLPWVTSGGVERRRLELARALPPAEFEQRVVCLQARDTLREEFERVGVNVQALGGTGSPLDYRTIWRVAREARAFKAEIVHGAVFEGVTLASLAGRLARVPRVIVEEISDGEDRSRRAQMLFRLYATAADECVAVSHYAKQQLVETGIAPHRIRVIINGVSPPQRPAATELDELRRRWGIQTNDLIVCTAGRLHNEHKRITDLIEALALARRRDTRLRLLVLGGGHELDSLREHARRQGVGEHVIFAGYRPNVGEGFALSHMFALASARESFGLAAVEAMWLGLPVIATAVGGLREIVEDGKTGRLVPPFQPARLATALVELTASETLRRQLGDAGRQRAERLFSAERYVQEVAGLYRHLGRGSRGVAA